MARKQKSHIIIVAATLAPVLAVLAVMWAMWSGTPPYSTTVTITPIAADADIEDVADELTDDEPQEPRIVNVSYDTTKVHWFRTRRLPAPLYKLFNDKQPVQYEAAVSKGISPITDVRSAYHNKLPIARVESCRAFVMDTLKHSLPYLQPDALNVLTRIGEAFSDSTERRCGHRSRIIVTSLLRTDDSVAKLRRRNRNAIANSTHRYGRTFDISYSNFAPDSSYILNVESQKNLLAEILHEVRSDSLIYVKHERKQGCFHITVR